MMNHQLQQMLARVITQDDRRGEDHACIWSRLGRPAVRSDVCMDAMIYAAIASGGSCCNDFLVHRTPYALLSAARAVESAGGPGTIQLFVGAASGMIASTYPCNCQN